jgi:PKD repeat protein
MKNAKFFQILIAGIIAVFSFACEDEEPPTADINASIDGYTATFSAGAINTTAYLWNFGDNNTSSEANPVHTYSMSGSFAVSLKVTGAGGEMTDTETIQILPSVEEMLSGGPAAANGKTWVLSRGYEEGKDGGSVIDDAMWVMLPSAENALDLIGMGQEYDNEFTFYHDGKYEVDVKNDTALAATLFGIFGGEVSLYTNDNNQFGLNLTSYEAPESATWTLHDENLVVDAVTDPLGTAVPAPHADRTITGRKWVSLSDGAYFGILDFPTTRKFVIKEITPEKMNVAMLICAYWPDPEGSGSIPTYFYHMTFVPKP